MIRLIKESAYLDSKKYRAENIFNKSNEFLHIYILKGFSFAPQ